MSSSRSISLLSLFLGALLGATQVGANVWRTLLVQEGRYLIVWIPGIIISAAYFLGVLFIIQGNILGYIGFSIGALIITTWMAKRYATRIHDSNNRSTRIDQHNNS